jgi:hypothetical protein
MEIQNSFEYIILIFIFSALAAVFIYKMSVIRQAAQFNLPAQLPWEGIRVPSLSTFRSVRGLGLLSLSDNNMNPRLILYENRLEYRVLFTNTIAYDQIERIQAVSWGCLHFLRFLLKDRNMTVGVRFSNARIRDDLAAFFRQKGIEIN